MAGNSRSHTKEIDSIISESRRRGGGSAKAPVRAAASGQASARKRSLSDDFILTDDDDFMIPVTKKSSSGAAASVKRPSNVNRNPSGGSKKPANVSRKTANVSRKTANVSKKPANVSKKPAVKAKKKKRTGLTVVLCIIALLVITAAGGLTWYLTSGSGTGPNSKFSDNVYVSGKSLKGLTMDDARALMKSVEDEMAAGIKVDVTAGDDTYHFTKDDFDYSFDTESVLAQAKAYSEEKGLKTEDQNYEIKMTVTDATCDDLIKRIAKDVKKDPKDAQVTAFDPSADQMFTISQESEGVVLDEEASLSALSGLINGGSISGTVEATLRDVKPKLTAGALQDSIVRLSSFSTYSSNNANGNENMRISLAACNGSVIEPGATWSFNDCTGNSNLESNGYLPAGVIVQGRSETGVGGGICQSSTTIYNAAILCGMQVVERQCHYYKSVYVDAGRDATIDYGNIDLRLSNPFDYQLFMKCWMDGTELNCEIYGMENPDFDQIEITTSEPSYFERGYTVYTTRTYLKDGSAVKTDDLPSSTYYTVSPDSGDDDDDEDADSNSSSSGSSSGDSSDSEVSSGDDSDDRGGDSDTAGETSDDSDEQAPDDGDSDEETPDDGETPEEGSDEEAPDDGAEN